MRAQSRTERSLRKDAVRNALFCVVEFERQPSSASNRDSADEAIRALDRCRELLGAAGKSETEAYRKTLSMVNDLRSRWLRVVRGQECLREANEKARRALVGHSGFGGG